MTLNRKKIFSARDTTLGMSFLFGCLMVISSTAWGGSTWLKRILSDDYDTFRSAQQEALQAKGPALNRYIQDLIQILKEDGVNHLNLLRASETLGMFGHAADEAVPDLIRLVKNAKEPQRSDFFDALVEIGATNESVDFFIATLASPDLGNTLNAVRALGALTTPSSAAVKALLRTLLMQKDPIFRMIAAEALANLRPWTDAEKTTLVEAMKSTDPSLKYAAAWLWKHIFPRESLNLDDVYKSILPAVTNVQCRAANKSFQVVVKSFSADGPDQDETMWVIDSEKRIQLVDFGGTLDLYSFIQNPANNSPCNVTSFLDAKGNVVIPLLVDNRPNSYEIAGMIFDTKANEVIAAGRRFGQISEETPKVEYRADGFAFLEELQLTDVDTCDAKETKDGCGTYKGKAILTRTDESIKVWWNMSYEPGKKMWKKNIDVKRTWLDSALKPYFKDADAMAKAFSFRKDKRKVGEYFYRHLTLAGGETWFCISRDKPSHDTLCRNLRGMRRAHD